MMNMKLVIPENLTRGRFPLPVYCYQNWRNHYIPIGVIPHEVAVGVEAALLGQLDEVEGPDLLQNA